MTKNSTVRVLICLTLIFAAFVLGFSLGRSTGARSTQISVEQSTASPDTEASGTEAALININTATFEELDSLPGIGPTLAQNIIDYRDTYGDFECIEDIMKVSGIGEMVFNDIRHLITV